MGVIFLIVVATFVVYLRYLGVAISVTKKEVEGVDEGKRFLLTIVGGVVFGAIVGLFFI